MSAVASVVTPPSDERRGSPATRGCCCRRRSRGRRTSSTQPPSRSRCSHRGGGGCGGHVRLSRIRGRGGFAQARQHTQVPTAGHKLQAIPRRSTGASVCLCACSLSPFPPHSCPAAPLRLQANERASLAPHLRRRSRWVHARRDCRRGARVSDAGARPSPPSRPTRRNGRLPPLTPPSRTGAHAPLQQPWVVQPQPRRARSLRG